MYCRPTARGKHKITQIIATLNMQNTNRLLSLQSTGCYLLTGVIL